MEPAAAQLDVMTEVVPCKCCGDLLGAPVARDPDLKGGT